MIEFWWQMVRNLMTHFPSQHNWLTYKGTGTSINVQHFDWWAGSKNWLKIFDGDFSSIFCSRQILLCTFEKNSLTTEKISRNRRLQENMESRQNLFFGAPSVLPPPFPPQSSSVCLCFNATLLGLVRCRDRQSVRRNNWFGRQECGVQRVPSPWSVHPLWDIIDGIVLLPRPPYWQAAMEVSDLTRANKKTNNIKHWFIPIRIIFLVKVNGCCK